MNSDKQTIPWFGNYFDSNREQLIQVIEASLMLEIEQNHTNLEECLDNINKQKRQIIIIEASISPKMSKGNTEICSPIQLYKNSLRLIEAVRTSELNKNCCIIVHEPQVTLPGYLPQRYLGQGANITYDGLNQKPDNQLRLVKSIEKRLQ